MHLSFDRFLAFTKWLYYRLYDTRFFFIDYWSFVHIISGFMLVIILFAFNFKYKKTIFVSLVVLWEVAEILFKYFALNIFHPETIKDQINDIAIGFIGGYTTYLLINNRWKIHSKIHLSPQFLSALFTALILGFLWSGTYQSQEGIEIFSTTGLIFQNFFFWSASIALFIFALFFLHRFLKKYWISFSIVCAIYYICLLAVGLIGGNSIINTPTDCSTSLKFLFKQIYGNQVISVGFVIAPFIIILHFIMLNYLLKKIFSQSISD
jgi:hypothetical protein